jgi:hypothetical protein
MRAIRFIPALLAAGFITVADGSVALAQAPQTTVSTEVEGIARDDRDHRRRHRPDRPDHRRRHRPDRPERVERPDRPERRERPVRVARVQRPERVRPVR